MSKKVFKAVSDEEIKRLIESGDKSTDGTDDKFFTQPKIVDELDKLLYTPEELEERERKRQERAREEHETQNEARKRREQMEREYPVGGRPPEEGELVYRTTLRGAGAFAGCDEPTPRLYGNYVKYKKNKRSTT